MKVIEFLDIFSTLTEEQKQLELTIEFSTPNAESCNDDQCELNCFEIDRILEYPGYVIVKGR